VKNAIRNKHWSTWTLKQLEQSVSTKNVDHGKTSVVESLTGVWTDVHSMEIKRGISIKLGYADAVIRKCRKCKGVEGYTTEEKCPICGSPTTFVRKISFVDAPGHETLMAIVIASVNIIDGALLIIAANEKCPQPQTKEHTIVLEALDITNVVVVQNKIDLVSPEKAKENYNQIKDFLKETKFANAPIIPISANYGINIDVLIDAIEKNILTPPRDETKDPLLYIARSFDVNRPGTKIDKLVGGVVGGSLIQGRLSIGDEIEIRPGIILDLEKESKESKEHHPKPIISKIVGLNAGKEKLESVKPGGLIGIATLLDPSFTKADSLVGNVVGLPGKLPPVHDEIIVNYRLFNRVDFENPPIKQDEFFVISVGTITTIGVVDRVKKGKISFKLRRSVCTSKGSRVALLRRIGQRWRLAGQGTIE